MLKMTYKSFLILSISHAIAPFNPFTYEFCVEVISLPLPVVRDS